ncbi:hypothetical protein MMC07_001072 [Pseudocyphellaria aurata]|nr:hypothetical protein [Pseudocyphellaria aurata]
MTSSVADTGISSSPDVAASSANASASLDIAIAGAGIAGLAAAIGLRRAGHKVTIFERSSFNHEVGAAIHVCPNASRVLLSWGFDPKRARLIVCRSGLFANAGTMEPFHYEQYGDIERVYSASWFLSHRVDLHNELKLLATRDEGPGEPVKIRLGAKVTGIDPSLGTVTLENGSTHKSDLVVGADGVHSMASSLVPSHGTPAAATGHSAYRFLIPTEELLADEETRPIFEGKDGQFYIFVGEKNRLVIYPCRNNELQNFVMIHSDNDKRISQEGWNISAKVADLLDECKSFHPSLLAVCRKAQDLNLWKLLYREPIQKWYEERLVLVGDAAHPMLPHQGQGGAQSIEDGAALGVLFSRFPAFTTAEDLDKTIGERLQGFESVRKDRASLMQIFSNAGQDEAEKILKDARRFLKDGVKAPANQTEIRAINFGHDVVGESERVLSGLV